MNGIFSQLPSDLVQTLIHIRNIRGERARCLFEGLLHSVYKEIIDGMLITKI